MSGYSVYITQYNSHFWRACWAVPRTQSATIHRQATMRVAAHRLVRRLASTAAANETRGRQRFYREVGVAPVTAESSAVESPISAGVDDSPSGVLSARSTTSNPQSGFGVTLDGRLLKTPMGQTLAVSSKALAHLLAAEWDAATGTINPTQMPLMTLVCTALDQTAQELDVWRDQILRFHHTDTIGYWSDPGEDRVLYRKQEQIWCPLFEHVETAAGFRPCRALGMEGMLMAKTNQGLAHPPELTEYAQQFVDGLDEWQLTVMHSVAAETKSFWIAWSLMQGKFSVDQALEAARLEEEFQIANWGLVEGGHDYDRLNASVQLRAAKVLLIESPVL